MTGLAYHPVLLVLRFGFELFALAGFAIWAWRRTPGPLLRFLTAIALPVAVGWAWGAFAVPGDESRSGETDFDTPGPIRLLLELAVFFGAAFGYYRVGLRRIAVGFAVLLAVYHVAAFDRIIWLLQN
ncbi:YrdB family protein [Spongiactinospora rosea]|nr:YrdB family protein [Spongiactinospora rosea]